MSNDMWNARMKQQTRLGELGCLRLVKLLQQRHTLLSVFLVVWRHCHSKWLLVQTEKKQETRAKSNGSAGSACCWIS
eukprot:3355111-Amphidinium_carterae.1